MRTVKQVSELTHISIRTLHHYDAIGLLKPTEITESGYRLYDDAALGRLQTILLFRELQFSLKEIKEILDDPEFDRKVALSSQITLLKLQKKRLDKLIGLAETMYEKEENTMDFNAFSDCEIQQYKEEVKERWQGTNEYREYERRNRSKQKSSDASQQMMELFAKLGALRHLDPANQQVQEKVKQLQQLITDNFYTCSHEVLYGLGQMYVGDERFKQNIDRAGGEGTAEFVREAITLYCKK